MPEGDTIHDAAARVGEALAGRRITAVEGSHAAVRREGRRFGGAKVVSVEAIGKHLLIHNDRGWSLRTHLGMTGRWHVYAVDERWRVTAGKARVVIRTEDAVAVCFAAPHVELGPTDRVLARLERLGPDLIATDCELDVVLTRARAANAATLADLLLDQHVAAGIGNVYKSEVLFLEHLAPQTPPDDVDDAALRHAYARAARLLRANVGKPGRTTTGRRGRESVWVYGRAGLPCRRCGTTISSDSHGPLDRVSYWCPSCQPPAPISRKAVNG